MWIRTVISVFAAAALGGPALAQGPSAYNVMPAWSGQQPQRPEPRTVYYKKDKNRSGVVLAAAADLATPLAAGQPGRNSDQPRMSETDAGKQFDPEIADPRKPSSDGSLPLFRLESEGQLVVRENAKRAADNKMTFPAQPRFDEPATNRPLAPMQMTVEPNFVCHGRLFFEDRNCERYGWSMGPLQPLFSAVQFFGDVSNLPYRFFSFPRLRYDCSAGLCLPGDPVPYMLYPPGLSLTGFAGAIGVNTALWAVFR